MKRLLALSLETATAVNAAEFQTGKIRRAANAILRRESANSAPGTQSLASPPRSRLAGFEEKLAAAAERAREQDDTTFDEVISLTEECVSVMRSAYSEFDDDYANAMLRDALAEAVSYISKIAAAAAIRQKAKRDEQEDLRVKIADNKSSTYTEIEVQISNLATHKAELDGLNARIGASQAHINELTNERDASIAKLKEIEQKKSAFEGWWWVPGYGIYLLVDYEKARAHVEEYVSSVQRAQIQLENLKNERINLFNALSDANMFEQELNKRFNELDSALNTCIAAINNTTASIIQYAELAEFFDGIASNFKFNDTDVSEVLTELSEIRVKLEKIFEKGGIAA